MPRQLEELLAQIPAGSVTTYGGLAAALGNPIAARWVGHFLMHHPHHAQCACHRVVQAGGRLGQYIAGEPAAKARRLRAEGVEVRDGAVDLERHGFDRFVSSRPLERLTKYQERLAGAVSFRSPRRTPRLVAGVDVSYPNPEEGVGAYSLVDLETARLVWSTTIRRRVEFPYITSYLTFRELPVLLDLVEAARSARRLADVFLVDGSGVLHPRHAGIATHFGIVTSLPTIGVTKKLLCGSVDLDGIQPLRPRPVVHEDRVIGLAIRPTSGSRRPIFVSPGNRVSLSFAEQVIRRALVGRRLPEPLYWADRLSRSAARTGSTSMAGGEPD